MGDTFLAGEFQDIHKSLHRAAKALRGKKKRAFTNPEVTLAEFELAKTVMQIEAFGKKRGMHIEVAFNLLKALEEACVPRLSLNGKKKE